MTLDDQIELLAMQINKFAVTSNSSNLLATAESCTGGLLASSITSISGSSSYFDRGFITYSNDAKKDLLGVLAKTLDTYGAVSQNIAEEMAIGAIKNSKANIAISVTGIAGPSGGLKEKPVGTVFIAIAKVKLYNNISKTSLRGIKEFLSDYSTDNYGIKTYIAKFLFTGDRNHIRKKSCIAALELFLDSYKNLI